MKNYFEKQIEAYLHFLLAVRGYSSHTIKTYRLNLFEAIGHVSIEKEDDLYTIDLIPYRMKLIGKNKKTIYKKISIFRSFSHYLQDEEVAVRLKNDDNIKVSKTLPKPVASHYILEALAKCDSQEKVLVLLLYTLGLRISEATNLKIKDIKNGWVRINGKGAKIREVPLLDEVRSVLDDYLKKYAPLVYIFEVDRVQISENKLRYTLSKVFKRIGIKATPHQLRHSFASDLLDGGARITDVSELLGHASLDTTQIYTKLSSSLKMKNYQKAHPMCRE
ncbi:MAG: tyrosine-type recombinase/integrase [Epsilonproteobacteria bacterium]|nr:tyrosine-type recombinase/integrase [Campylobacterota bacterium]